MKYLILLFTCISFSASSQEYSLENASVTFEIKNAGITVDGSFDSVMMDMSIDRKKMESIRLSGKVYAATIHTGIGLRDKHLRNEDYFEVEKYPWITMETVRMEENSAGELTGTFKLTIKDYSKEITFPVTYDQSKNAMNFSGSFMLDRQEFGLGEDSIILSDEVVINLNANFIK